MFQTLFFGNAGHSVPGRSKPELADGDVVSVDGTEVVEVVAAGGALVVVAAADVVVVAAEVDVVTALALSPFGSCEPGDRAACSCRAPEVTAVVVVAPVGRGAPDELVHPAMASNPIVIASAGARLVPRTDLFIIRHDGSGRVFRPATAHQLKKFICRRSGVAQISARTPFHCSKR